jgi:hypothetical protein
MIQAILPYIMCFWATIGYGGMGNGRAMKLLVDVSARFPFIIVANFTDPPTASDDPRGFIVKVFLDPDDPYSTREWLANLEWQSAIVRE